jgi:uncharacterized protein (DUF58 family)
MRPTRVLVALLIGGGLVGWLISGSAAYSRLIYVGLLLGLGMWAWTIGVARSLRVDRQADSLRASVGDIFKEHYEIQNVGRLRAPWIEIVNESSLPGAAGSRVVALLRGGEKQSYVARTWLTRRGGFALGPTSVTVSDPFGLFRIERRIPAARSLVVLPMIFPISSFVAPPGILPGGQVIRRKAIDMTPHAAGVREYSPGDELKRIHWPTTARVRRVMVKEFEQDPQAEVWLFLDAHASVHAEKPVQPKENEIKDLLFARKPKYTLPPSTLDYGISIAASLVHYFIAQRRGVGLVTEGRVYTVIQAERSERQESKLLETMAFVEARGSLSIAGLVAAHATQLPQGSSAILITPTIWPELLAAVEDLEHRNLRPIVILLMAETFGGRPGGERLLGSLAERGVPVFPIYCDANISNALAGFASSTHSEGLGEWQRPPLSHLT